MSKKNVAEVVIVGAGASGLAAARELEKNGVKSIIILEASNRVGGRANTIATPSGGFVDLGAQWIHGQLENELYLLAASKNMIGNYLSTDGEGDFHTDSGEKIDESLITELQDICHDIKLECQKFVHSYERPPLSVGHYFRSRFDECLNLEKDPKIRTLKDAFFHWYMRWEMIDNSSVSMFTLSAKKWEYIPCRGFDNMNPKSGMTSLLLRLQDDSNAEVKLETEVTEIRYDTYLTNRNHTRPVIVHCRTGEIYECNHVIVTCSLGYLKKNKDHLFKPALPSSMDMAITNIGYGVIDKIFIEFEKPFWGPDCNGIHLVWTGNEIPDFERINSDTRLINGKKLPLKDFWYRAISGFDPIYGDKSILCGWICGPEAEYMETLDEKEVGRVCGNLFRKFLNKSIPDPIRVYRSQWASNPLTLGSYSHRLVSSDNSKEDWIQCLNEPIWSAGDSDHKVPLVVFAGEANHSKYYSTVHGAIGNGIAQVKHYLQYRKRFGHRDDVTKSNDVTRSKL